MFYKIKNEELVIYDEDLFGRKGNKVMSIKVEHLGLMSFAKKEAVEIKALLVKKDMVEIAGKIVGGK